MTLRILNVNSTLDLITGGGTAERTFQMSRYLAMQGAHCKVLTIHSDYLDERRVATLKPAELEVLPCLWRRFNFPKIDWGKILRLVNEADIVHLMGHWSVLNVLVYIAARQAGKPYVVCPAGALPLFGRSRWLKRVYNFLVGANIIRNASGWIAVTKAEFDNFEAYGISSSRVTVIPNGVNEEDFPVVDANKFKHQFGLPNAPMILFMGRLNLIKGPDLLLDAFISVRDAFPKLHLIYAGPDGGMLAALQKRAVQNGVSEFIHYLGYVNNADKAATYQMANLLVVPSRQEAMSIVAIEAGFCGTPVLLTDQCGFPEVGSIDSRLEVAASVAGIADGLINLLSDPNLLDSIAPKWSTFVKRHYSWSSLAPQYFKLYFNIINSNIT